jgi:hypothetical protein
VPGPVDDAHAAPAEHRLDRVAGHLRQVAPGYRRGGPDIHGAAHLWEQGVELGTGAAHLPPAGADLGQQLGAGGADLFRRGVRGEQLLEQPFDALALGHYLVPPVRAAPSVVHPGRGGEVAQANRAVIFDTTR